MTSLQKCYELNKTFKICEVFILLIADFFSLFELN